MARDMNEGSHSVTAEERRQAVLLLQALFCKLVAGETPGAPPPFATVPWLVDAVCQLVSSFAPWFPGPLTSLLDPTIRYPSRASAPSSLPCPTCCGTAGN